MNFMDYLKWKFLYPAIVGIIAVIALVVVCSLNS